MAPAVRSRLLSLSLSLSLSLHITVLEIGKPPVVFFTRTPPFPVPTSTRLGLSKAVDIRRISPEFQSYFVPVYRANKPSWPASFLYKSLLEWSRLHSSVGQNTPFWCVYWKLSNIMEEDEKVANVYTYLTYCHIYGNTLFSKKGATIGS